MSLFVALLYVPAEPLLQLLWSPYLQDFLTCLSLSHKKKLMFLATQKKENLSLIQLCLLHAIEEEKGKKAGTQFSWVEQHLLFFGGLEHLIREVHWNQRILADVGVVSSRNLDVARDFHGWLFVVVVIQKMGTEVSIKEIKKHILMIIWMVYSESLSSCSSFLPTIKWSLQLSALFLDPPTPLQSSSGLRGSLRNVSFFANPDTLSFFSKEKKGKVTLSFEQK